MRKLEGRAQKLIRELEEQGKVKILTFEQSAKIDSDFAKEFAPVKREFERKERASRAYIAQIESTHYEC